LIDSSKEVSNRSLLVSFDETVTWEDLFRCQARKVEGMDDDGGSEENEEEEENDDFNNGEFLFGVVRDNASVTKVERTSYYCFMPHAHTHNTQLYVDAVTVHLIKIASIV